MTHRCFRKSECRENYTKSGIEARVIGDYPWLSLPIPRWGPLPGGKFHSCSKDMTRAQQISSENKPTGLQFWVQIRKKCGLLLGGGLLHHPTTPFAFPDSWPLPKKQPLALYVGHFQNLQSPPLGVPFRATQERNWWRK